MATMTRTNGGSLDLDKSISRIQSYQRRKKTMAVVALVAAVCAAIGITSLMYLDTPAEQPVERIGAPVLE